MPAARAGRSVPCSLVWPLSHTKEARPLRAAFVGGAAVEGTGSEEAHSMLSPNKKEVLL